MASRENDFQPSVEELDALCEAVSPRAVLLTHPGSPSGTLLSPAVREWVVAKSRETGLYGIIDEVFVDFCEDESFKKFLEASPRLVLIRSMTKFYGIPGLRLGYLLTSPEVADAAPPPPPRSAHSPLVGQYPGADRRVLLPPPGGLQGTNVVGGEKGAANPAESVGGS